MNIITQQATTVAVAQKTLTIPDSPTYQSVDDKNEKTVQIILTNAPFSFFLWKGDAYTAAADYTQAQLDTAVAAYLTSIKVT